MFSLTPFRNVWDTIIIFFHLLDLECWASGAEVWNVGVWAAKCYLHSLPCSSNSALSKPFGLLSVTWNAGMFVVYNSPGTCPQNMVFAGRMSQTPANRNSYSRNCFQINFSALPEKNIFFRRDVGNNSSREILE